MRRIGLRVDASTVIGLGHVKRCLSLAHAMRVQGATAHFVLRSLDLDAAEMVRAGGYPFTMLPAPEHIALRRDLVPHAAWAGVNWETDVNQTCAALGNLSVDGVLIDHYAFDSRWHNAVGQRLGCRLVAVDDLADREMSVDVLIDHNVAVDHRAKFAGLLPERAMLLGGPHYALLGANYATARRYAFHETVRSIGIFMGGTDSSNLSITALRACRGAGFSGSIEIVTTLSNPHLQMVQAAAMDDGKTSLSLDLPELSGFFARHDLHIGASGGATWERCCIGSPTIAVVAAQNQHAVIDPLRGYGVIHIIDSVPPDAADLLRSVRWLIDHPAVRYEMAGSAMALVDGLGATRVAGHLLKL